MLGLACIKGNKEFSEIERNITQLQEYLSKYLRT